MLSPKKRKAPGANRGLGGYLETDFPILDEKTHEQKPNHQQATAPIGEFAGQKLSSLPDYAVRWLVDHVDRDHAFWPALDSECLRRIHVWASCADDDRIIVRVAPEDSGYARELINAGTRVLSRRYSHSPALVAHLAELRTSLHVQISCRESA